MHLVRQEWLAQCCQSCTHATRRGSRLVALPHECGLLPAKLPTNKDTPACMYSECHHTQSSNATSISLRDLKRSSCQAAKLQATIVWAPDRALGGGGTRNALCSQHAQGCQHCTCTHMTSLIRSHIHSLCQAHHEQWHCATQLVDKNDHNHCRRTATVCLHNR